MKRRNRSKFTRTDVDSICKMQHRIDRLQLCVLAIFSKIVYNVEPSILQEDDIDDAYISMAGRVIKELKAYHNNGNKD